MPFCWKCLRARASGPKSRHSERSHLPALTDRRTRLSNHLHALALERHPDSAPLALSQAEEYLAEQFSLLRWDTSREPFEAWGRSFQNILAVKTPSDGTLKGRMAPLIIGAHYDTVVGSPGADDNASALAVLLETAWQLSSIPISRPVWIMAFCLEEQGLLGSRAFVSKLKESGQAIAGAIVLECVGYTNKVPGSQRMPSGVPIAVPETGNFLGIIGNDASRALVVTLARNAQRINPPLPVLTLVVPAGGEQLPDVRRSDHAAFWDQGYPAVMLTDTANFRNPHYHQPTDRIETLDFDFIEAVSETVVAAVTELAGKTDL